MATSKPLQLSEFGQAALCVDEEMTQFETLVQEFSRLNIESDKGLDRAVTLIAEINDCRGRMEVGMQSLSKSLLEARQRNQAAEELVADRSQAVNARQQSVENMIARFRTLGERVKLVDVTAAELRKASDSPLEPEEKDQLRGQIPALDDQLAALLMDVSQLVEDARVANLQLLERNADSLKKSLSAARNKISLFIDRKLENPVVN